MATRMNLLMETSRDSNRNADNVRDDAGGKASEANVVKSIVRFVYQNFCEKT